MNKTISSNFDEYSSINIINYINYIQKLQIKALLNLQENLKIKINFLKSVRMLMNLKYVIQLII